MVPRRVKVLFLPTRTELKEPWEGDVVGTTTGNLDGAAC